MGRQNPERTNSRDDAWGATETQRSGRVVLSQDDRQVEAESRDEALFRLCETYIEVDGPPEPAWLNRYYGEAQRKIARMAAGQRVKYAAMRSEQVIGQRFDTEQLKMVPETAGDRVATLDARIARCAERAAEHDERDRKGGDSKAREVRS